MRSANGHVVDHLAIATAHNVEGFLVSFFSYLLSQAFRLEILGYLVIGLLSLAFLLSRASVALLLEFRLDEDCRLDGSSYETAWRTRLRRTS
jgi:hypothetical protein